jgi:hypothetical protein
MREYEICCSDGGLGKRLVATVFVPYILNKRIENKIEYRLEIVLASAVWLSRQKAAST